MRDKERFVGEPIVAVVAETRAQASDAIDALEIDYEPLPAVSDPEAGLEPGAPLVYEEFGTNRADRLIKRGGDVHGRGQTDYVEAAVTRAGEMVGLKVRAIADLGGRYNFTERRRRCAVSPGRDTPGYAHAARKDLAHPFTPTPLRHRLRL